MHVARSQRVSSWRPVGWKQLQSTGLATDFKDEEPDCFEINTSIQLATLQGIGRGSSHSQVWAPIPIQFAKQDRNIAGWLTKQFCTKPLWNISFQATSKKKLRFGNSVLIIQSPPQKGWINIGRFGKPLQSPACRLNPSLACLETWRNKAWRWQWEGTYSWFQNRFWVYNQMINN